MGRNRKAASPEAYPSAFLRAVEAGSGVMFAGDLPWTPVSSAKRFRLLLALLKDSPGHPLSGRAKARWSVRATPQGLEVQSTARGTPMLRAELGVALIEAALASGGNPGKP